MPARLTKAKRIVIKIGSALLVDRESGVKQDWLNALADDIAALTKRGKQVLLVSSGAIALGRNVLKFPRRPLKLDESQAAAAVGQIALGKAWADALGARDIVAGQILLTLNDTEGQASRRSYLNARDTIERLLKLGAVPVVNENDTVATSEIRYGDNDRLAARVATMMDADLLILLSDIDGLYTAPPNENADAEFIPQVDAITPEIEAMAGSAGSELSRGGMVTKIEAGKIATRAGTAMVITSGTRMNPIAALEAGERATWFDAAPAHGTARKNWIAGQLEPSGTITIDDGAAKALTNGKSLLPAGVRTVDGTFDRGDAVAIQSLSGTILGHGLIAYDCDEARLIAGKRSEDLAALLGYEGRSTMIHRDDMALAPKSDTKNHA
ncbi:glutamate 5-kinase [Pseudahrensia aquimaris]|uniref:Glutamate 5-kinase n=1 Tax=Pseudahrensia aquimaris TaxID=744461 RepID=A0ABW3FDI8_9HYPH